MTREPGDPLEDVTRFSPETDKILFSLVNLRESLDKFIENDFPNVGEAISDDIYPNKSKAAYKFAREDYPGVKKLEKDINDALTAVAQNYNALPTETEIAQWRQSFESYKDKLEKIMEMSS